MDEKLEPEIKVYLTENGITGFAKMNLHFKVGANRLLSVLQKMQVGGQVMIHTHGPGFRVQLIENHTPNPEKR